MRRKFLHILLAGAAMMSIHPSAFADSGQWRAWRDGKHDDDHDIYDARRAGKVLPLNEIMKKLEGRLKGAVIEIEFEYEYGRPVYEFKYVTPQGRLREMYVDARTGEVVRDEEDD